MKKIPPSSSRKTLTFLGITSIMFCFAIPNASADAKTGIPETINLNIQANHAEIAGLPKDKKAVNNFTHQKHATEYLKGNSKYATQLFSDDFTCAACHLDAKKPADLTDSIAQERVVAALATTGGPKNLKKYFHGICLNCHKSMAKSKIATGPTKCNGCHKRK